MEEPNFIPDSRQNGNVELMPIIPPAMPPVIGGNVVDDGGSSSPTSSFMRGSSCIMPDGSIVEYDGPQPFRHLSPCPVGYVPPNLRSGGSLGDSVVGDDSSERCKPFRGPNGEFLLPPGCMAGGNVDDDETERDCITAYNDCHKRIVDDIDDTLNECDKCCGNTTIIILGDIDEQFEKPQRCIANCEAKVGNDIAEKLINCYTQSQQLGIPFPSDEQVAFGNHTGEQLKSCFTKLSESGELYSDCWNEELLGPNPFPCSKEPPYCPPPKDEFRCDERITDGKPFTVEIDDTGKPVACKPLECPQGFKPIEYPEGSGFWVCVRDDSHDLPDKDVPDRETPPNPCNYGLWEYLELMAKRNGYSSTDAMLNADGKLYRELQKYWVDQNAICMEGTRPVCNDPFGKLVLPNWCSASISEMFNSLMSSNLNTKEELKKYLGIERDNRGRWCKNWLTSSLYDAELVPDWIPDLLNSALNSAIDAAWELHKFNGKCEENQTGQSTFLATILSIARLSQRWFGIPGNDWIQRVEYSLNALCPTMIPSTQEASMMFLADTISKATWAAYVGANNDCIEPQELNVRAMRTRPTAREIVELRNRGAITQEQFDRAMRESGVIEFDDKKRFEQLAIQYPGMADIIRFMLRDVADQKIVERYNLTAEFTDKWQGRLPQYAIAQGMTTELAEDYWKAHWEFPSNTQLYQMVHRLRPGRVDKAIEVTKQDAANVLAVNDILPFWRERMLAISHNVITRVDARRAYEIGEIDDDELYQIFQDQGYNERDARILQKFFAKLKSRQESKREGADTMADIQKKYVAGYITDAQLFVRLTRAGIEQNKHQTILANFQRKRDDSLRIAATKSIENQFKNQEIDSAVARIRLMDLNYDNTAIQYHIELWSTERDGRSKMLTGAQLCRARERSLITQDEQIRMLINSGYSREDARRIVTMCEQDNDDKAKRKLDAILNKEAARKERQRKDEERRAKEARREAEKAARDAERRAKEAKKEAEKKRKEDEKKEKEKGE